jgi:hypothetical protein
MQFANHDLSFTFTTSARIFPMTHSTSVDFFVDRLVEGFVSDHPEYEAIDERELHAYLAGVYDEVLQGVYTAKSEERLEAESRHAGISRNHYLDLVNLTTHAAADRPREQE